MKIRVGMAQTYRPRLPSKLPDFELTSECYQNPETRWSSYHYRLRGTTHEVAMKILRSGHERILVEFEDQMSDWILEMGYEDIFDDFLVEAVE